MHGAPGDEWAPGSSLAIAGKQQVLRLRYAPLRMTDLWGGGGAYLGAGPSSCLTVTPSLGKGQSGLSRMSFSRVSLGRRSILRFSKRCTPVLPAVARSRS